MDKKEEYAVAGMVLVALVVAAVSIFLGSTNLGLAAAVVAIIAVLYAIYVIHSDISEIELQRSYEHGYADHARGKQMSKRTSQYGAQQTSSDYEESRDSASDEYVQAGADSDESGQVSSEEESEEETPSEPESADGQEETAEPKPRKQPARHRGRRSTHTSEERAADNTASPIYMGTGTENTETHNQ